MVAWMIPAAIGLSALGSGYNAYTQDRAARRARRDQQALLGEARRMRQTGPGAAEGLIRQLLGQDAAGGFSFTPEMIDLGSLPGMESFNTGQDSLMQMLRAGPGAVDRSLASMVETGNPFDTSPLFDALGVQDRRARDEGLASVYAGASGLGERFGSATARGATDFLTRFTEGLNTRNAGIASGAYEAAQGRRLQAADQITGREQVLAGIAQALQSAGLNMADLGVRATGANNQAGVAAAGLGQAQQGLRAQLLQMLLGAEQGRNQFNLQTLGLGMGAQSPQPAYTYGSAAGDLGQLLLMMQLMGGQQGGGGAPVPQFNRYW